MTEDRLSLCLLVHGESGAGKSWLGHTTPGPRLVLDAEGGSRFARKMTDDGKAVRIKRVAWNPQDPPPEPGEWEACTVAVQDFGTLEQVFAWLNTGKHPFKSVVLDSLTEIQKRCKDAIKNEGLGQGQGEAEDMNERRWGILLDRMEKLVRDFRDLVFHPVHPLESVVLIALTHEKTAKFKPAIQGGLATSLPGYLDVIGYLASYTDEDGEEHRQMLVRNHERYQAKDRTHVIAETYGGVVPDPNVETLLGVLNDEENA